MTTFAQRSFAGGEISPRFHRRPDLAKFSTGSAAMRNMLPINSGAAQNRSGTHYLDQTLVPGSEVRLTEFIFSDSDTCILEWGNLYLAFIQNGAHVLEASQSITAISQASPAVLTKNAHGYANGDFIRLTVLGMTQLTAQTFKVANVTANTLQLQYLHSGGATVSSASMSAFVSGTMARVYKIATPYASTILRELQFAQSYDVVTVTHSTLAPRALARTAATNWSLTAIAFNPQFRPYECASTVGAAGTQNLRYKVTVVKLSTGEESYSGASTLAAGPAVNGITNANPATVTTAAAHNLTTGDTIVFGSAVGQIFGMTEVNYREFTVRVTGANTFELQNVDSTAYGVYAPSALDTVLRTFTSSPLSAPTTAAPNIVSWDHWYNIRTGVISTQDIFAFNVYKDDGSGVFGFIGSTTALTLKDSGFDPDFEHTPPEYNEIFSGYSVPASTQFPGVYPAAVAYYQQRRVFANTTNDPQAAYASKIDQKSNFTKRTPIQSDDMVRFSLAGQRVNQIRFMVDLGKLILFTRDGEWAILGNDGSGALTPSDINPRQQSYNGIKEDLAPLVIDADALFVQERGGKVRSLAFTFEVDGYRGNDLSVFAEHLFRGKEVVSWAYQKTPNSVIWLVLDDGSVVSLTYIREHQIWGFARHDLHGLAKSVAVIPEGTEHAVYFVVERELRWYGPYLSGVGVNTTSTSKYIEKLSSRDFEDIEDATFLDSYLSYDGWNATATTLTASGADYTPGHNLTLTASVATFAATDVGKEFWLRSGGTVYRLTVVGFTSTTVVTVQPQATLPVALQATATTDWAAAIQTLTGLWHNCGQFVSVLADGYLGGNPNRHGGDPLSTQLNYRVGLSSGGITLSRFAAKIHCGLPITADLKMLPIDFPQGETLMGKAFNLTNVMLHVEESRGIWAGQEEPDGDGVTPDPTADGYTLWDDPLEKLYELKIRNEEGYEDPVFLKTGVVEIPIPGAWKGDGSVFIRQTDPLPLTILAVAREGSVAG